MRTKAVLLPAALLVCFIFAGCGEGIDSSVSDASQASELFQEQSSSIDASTSTASSDDTGSENAGEDAVPIYGDQIEDGTYEIEVSSSSSMFRVVNARLTVTDGEMTVVLTLSGTGYEKLYMGTGEQASVDTDDQCIYYVEDGEGAYTYEVPVEALDLETDVAAWSIRKQAWYDRQLIFQSSLIPDEAIK